MAVVSRFEIFRDSQGLWRFRLRAANHKIVCQSEGYTSRRGCLNGIDSVKRCSGGADITEL